jgi:hypothetical protein
MPRPRQTLSGTFAPAAKQLMKPLLPQVGSSSSAASQGTFGPLNTPFKRLGALPETMNWAGLWSGSVTYFKNDVAFDTVADGSYVLLVTSKTGGSRPGADPTNWQRLNPASAGGDITAVLTPGGSGLSGGATSGAVTLQNTGVLELTQGSGISITGTKANYTIANTGAATTTNTNNYLMSTLVTVPDSGSEQIISITFTTTVANANVALYPNFHLLNQTNTVTANVNVLLTISAGGAIRPISNAYASIVSIPRAAGATDISLNTPFFVSCTTAGSYTVIFFVTADAATSGGMYIPANGASQGYVIAVGPIASNAA